MGYLEESFVTTPLNMMQQNDWKPVVQNSLSNMVFYYGPFVCAHCARKAATFRSQAIIREVRSFLQTLFA